MADTEEDRIARRFLDLDVDPIAVLCRRHLERLDRLLRRPALLDLDDHLSSFAGADVDGAVERGEVEVGVPATVNRFSSRTMCPCESTTTQAVETKASDRVATAGSTDFIR